MNNQNKFKLSKYAKRIHVNYNVGSPYGIINPAYIAVIGVLNVYLPLDYSELSNFLNTKNLKTLSDIDKACTEFTGKLINNNN